MQTSNQSFRKAFVEDQTKRTDRVLDEAQRLVNLYRHADAFGADFAPKLDQMLLSLSPEVLSALSNILGGEVVRRYYTYLKDKTSSGHEQPAPDETIIPQQGYLPDPTQNEVVSTSGADATDINRLLKEFLTAHQQELNEVLKAQSTNLETILKRIDQTVANPKYPTNYPMHTIEQGTKRPKEYADVIESGTQTAVFVPDETEGF